MVPGLTMATMMRGKERKIWPGSGVPRGLTPGGFSTTWGGDEREGLTGPIDWSSPDVSRRFLCHIVRPCHKMGRTRPRTRAETCSSRLWPFSSRNKNKRVHGERTTTEWPRLHRMCTIQTQTVPRRRSSARTSGNTRQRRRPFRQAFASSKRRPLSTRHGLPTRSGSSSHI